jgi:glycerophosphoryl diester phosphodiesterase
MALVVALGLGCGGTRGNGTPAPTPPVTPSRILGELLDPASRGPFVAAHRGDHVAVPENSLAAIRQAAKAGADFAEIDVRPTLDGVLVLMHDTGLLRTTGLDASVAAVTWARIQGLTLVGADPADAETRRVPSFAQALALAGEVGIMLYVDIKTDRDDLLVAGVQAGPTYDVSLLRCSLDQAVRLHALDARCWIMPAAATREALAEVLKALPDTRIVELDADDPDPAFGDAARQAGVKVQQDAIGTADFAGAMGNENAWRKFSEAGVWLIQTDVPELLVPLARAWRESAP